MDNSQPKPIHSREAEQATLGGIMLLGERGVDMVVDVLCADDFFEGQHKLIFKAILYCTESNATLDPISICDHLHKEGTLKQTDSSYVADLATRTPSATNVVSYAKIVKEHSMVRRLLDASTEIASLCMDRKSLPLASLIERAQQSILEASDESRAPNPMQSLVEVVPSVLDVVQERSESGTGMVGVSTGFKGLDEKISGLPASDLIIIAGRPSMGKTLLGVLMAKNVASQGVMTCVFSLEMDADSLVMRLFAERAQVPIKNIREGNLQAEEWDRLAVASAEIKGYPIHIDATSGITPNHIRSRVRRLQRSEKKPCGLIVVDYIQLMRVASNETGREAIVSEITRSLKEVAKEFKCPVVALSQLNRAVENRPPDQRRPRNSDLRESGAIEQDADVIIHVYRDEVYNKHSNNKGMMELIIGKQRNGSLGKVILKASLDCQQLEDYEDAIDPEDNVQPVSAGMSYGGARR